MAKGFAFRKELLFRVAAEKSHVTRFSVVLLVVETALRDGDAANFGEWRQCSDNLKITAVEEAVHLDVLPSSGMTYLQAGASFATWT